MPNTWFTSDLHIGHRNIIKYCNRPFINHSKPEDDKFRYQVSLMDEAIVENWNAVVAPEDTVHILGDLAFCCSDQYALVFLSRLNGIKHVIEGNHDAIAKKIHSWHPTLFASWERLTEIEVEGQQIVLCHYALREWHHALRGVWHLFGHTHASLPGFGKSVDVGFDNSHNIAPDAIFRPVSFQELKSYMDRQKIGSHPEFENYTPDHPELKMKSYTEIP